MFLSIMLPVLSREQRGPMEQMVDYVVLVTLGLALILVVHILLAGALMIRVAVVRSIIRHSTGTVALGAL